MATVTGMTAEAIEALVANLVSTISVDETTGNMSFTKKDGTTVSIGNTSTAALQKAYPVSSIFMTTSNVNPNATFGFGTWIAWGSGRVPVGVDAAQTEFNTVEKTAGAKTHQLTAAEMPAHVHDMTHDHDDSNLNVTTASDATLGANGVRVTKVGSVGAAPSGSTTAGAALNIIQYNGDTKSTGGGGAHNNLQPYITCYMWKRTA